jgi:hypothetical protein
MADQSILVTNMPDSGSPQRVAFDLMKEVIYRDETKEYKNKDEILVLYTECLKAAWGQSPKKPS